METLLHPPLFISEIELQFLPYPPPPPPCSKELPPTKPKLLNYAFSSLWHHSNVEKEEEEGEKGIFFLPEPTKVWNKTRLKKDAVTIIVQKNKFTSEFVLNSVEFYCC